MNKFNKTTLEELKAKNLPHATAADLGITIAVDISTEDAAAAAAKIAELNKYLEAFTIMEDGKCVCCGAIQGAKDPIMGLLTGACFTWGIAHGEGFCGQCRYPGRARHFVGEWLQSGAILQYHPDGLTFK